MKARQSEARFEFHVHGEDVESGTMDVKELAPALLALGELIEEANKVVNRNQAHMSVRVQADFQRNSFDIFFQIWQSLRELLIHTDVTAAKELLEWIGIIKGVGGVSTYSLIRLIKWLKGRKISEKSIVMHDDSVTITSDSHNENNITVNKNVYNMYCNYPVRRALEGVVRPLENDGLDSLEFFHDGDIAEKIEKSEREYFKVTANSEDPMYSEAIKAFQIVMLVFKQKNKWRLSDGTSTIPVTITDEKFLKKIDDGEFFGKNDILVVRIRTKQWSTPDGLKTEYEVVEVIDHKRQDQLSLGPDFK